jgi:hypothetical protein
VLEATVAVLAVGVSLLLPSPVVAVATEGQWTAIAESGGANDCDRVSIWSIKVYRLGRKTSCATSRHRIAALAEIDNRAVWLHVSGVKTLTWTLWTATTTSTSPKLLARVTAASGRAPPIVIGPGNTDRGQATYGEASVLPYAIGRRVAVLNVAGKRTLTWTAPSAVVGFATDAGVLVVATTDGTLFVWNYAADRGLWVQRSSHPAVFATRVGYDGLDVVVQQGRRLQSLDMGSAGCRLGLMLAPGEHLAGAGGGRIAILAGNRYRVLPGCGGRAVASGTATAFSLDSNHFVTANGRGVTRYQLLSP